MVEANKKNSLGKFVIRVRPAILSCALLSALACLPLLSKLDFDAGFYQSIPARHDMIEVYKRFALEFSTGNRIVIALEQRQGDVFNPGFFRKLEELSNEVYFIPGVDKSKVRSFFTPNIRYTEIVQSGFTGGTVIPADFDGSAKDLDLVKKNIQKSAQARRLLSSDATAAMIIAPLVELDPISGEQLDYAEVARQLDEKIRKRFVSDDYDIHIIGFAQFMGNIVNAIKKVVLFFILAVVVCFTLLVYLFRSVILALLPITLSVLAVCYLLAIMSLLGISIHPFGVLVPFLIFAIGVSHGLQFVMAWKKAYLRYDTPTRAANYCIDMLARAGIVALLSDSMGFLTITLIDIPVIQQMGMSACLGVAILIFTNIILLPVALSYFNPKPGTLASHKRSLSGLWPAIAELSVGKSRSYILAFVLVLIFIAGPAAYYLPTGDLQQGAPELKSTSRYNQDLLYISEKFNKGNDVLVVYAEAAEDACIDYEIMRAIDNFVDYIEKLPGVISVDAVTKVAKRINVGWHEGYIKWYTLPRTPAALGETVSPIETSSGLLNHDCSVMPVYIFMADHRGETIASLVKAVKQFEPNAALRFMPGGGNLGILAATNDVVDAAQVPILASVYSIVFFLCILLFRSIISALCIIVPLFVVSILAYALMYWLGIGLKVSTLPVVALGAGIGVDYSIYLLSYLYLGSDKKQGLLAGYISTLQNGGSAIVVTAGTLAISVGLWVFSELQYQADMGLLLSFMLLVNMLAALVIMPSLYFYFQPEREKIR